MVLPASPRISRVPRYSGTPLSWLQISRTGVSPSLPALSRAFRYRSPYLCVGPTTPVKEPPPVWALPLSLATTQGIISYFLFLRVLRCFSSPGWLPFGCYTFSVTGCPIRKSRDIMLVCSSPELIAAYHVLLRLLVPRHPPYALICFKYFSLIFPRSPYQIVSLLSDNRKLFSNMSKNLRLSALSMCRT